MLLSEVCLRELYSYYNLEFPEQPQAHQETAGLDSSAIREGAERYRTFERRAKQLLADAGLEESALHFLYVILPALYRSAAETYEKPESRNEEIEQMVEDFLSGYESSYLPFYLITIAIKTLEKTLFRETHHRGPSLDIGINDGFASNYVLAPHKITVGSEPMFLSLLSAKTRPRHEHFMAVDATCIPFEDESFNTVYLVHSIDHVKDRMDVLREVERVLKPGGTIVLSDASQYIEEFMPMSKIYRQMDFDGLANDAFNYFLDFGGERVEFYSPEIYQRVLGEMGFEDVHVEYFMASKLAKLCYAQFELQLVLGTNDAFMRAPENHKMREFFFDAVKSAIVPLISADRQLCREEGKGLNLFVRARKRGAAADEAGASEADILNKVACPQCRQPLPVGGETWSCATCNLDYPVVDSIPLLIPFYAEGHASIKELLASRPAVPEMEAAASAAAATSSTPDGLAKRALKKVPFVTQLVRTIRSNGPRG